MKLKIFILTAVLVCLTLSNAFADGKVFQRARAKVIIPDQRAIIAYENGVETLVIETSFNGEGNEFAWIVPVPENPKIEAVSPGVFNTCDQLFQPQLHYQKSSLYIWVFVFWLLILVCFLLSKIYHTSVIPIMIWMLFMFMLYMCAIPTLLSANRSPHLQVDVIQRGNIGSFETAVVSGKDTKALTDWLSSNGFYVPEKAEPAIKYYVDKGWVFVAAKLRKEGDGGEYMATHPLSFAFKAEKPVYPLRMTAADSGDCSIDLYIFGKMKASAKKFELKRCDYLYRERQAGIPVVHEGLQQIAGIASVGTKLSAILSPEDMLEDCEIEWEEYGYYKPDVYTASAAFSRTMDFVVPVSLLLFTVLILLNCSFYFGPPTNEKHLPSLSVQVKVTLKRGKWRHLLISLIILIVASFLAGKLIYSTYPVIDAEYTFAFRDPVMMARYDFEVDNEKEGIKDVREYFREKFKHEKNYYTGGEIKEEDSPGNYLIRENKNGEVIFVSFDQYGEENETVIVKAKE